MKNLLTSKILNKPMFMEGRALESLSMIDIDVSKVQTASKSDFENRAIEVDMRQASEDVKSFIDSNTMRNLARGSVPVSVVGSVAVMFVSGPIWKELDFWTWLFYGGVSSSEISYKLDLLNKVSGIDGVVIEWDSPGGDADGSEYTAKVLHEVAKNKPVISVVNSLCASAAYEIASGSTKILLNESTARAGSIGCYMAHIDVSERNQKYGVKITEISKGDLKTAGSSNRPLDDAGHDEIMRIVSAFYSSFLNIVAEYRNLDRDAIEKTIGRSQVFVGQEAIDIGLADDFGSIETAIQLVMENNMPTGNSPKNEVTKETVIASLNYESLKAHNIALYNQVRSEGFDAGKKEGGDAERDRISGILSFNNEQNKDIIMAAVNDPNKEKGDVAIDILAKQNENGVTHPKNEAPGAVRGAETPKPQTKDKTEDEEIKNLVDCID